MERLHTEWSTGRRHTASLSKVRHYYERRWVGERVGINLYKGCASVNLLRNFRKGDSQTLWNINILRLSPWHPPDILLASSLQLTLGGGRHL